MLMSLVTAADRWRFERPLAIVLGLAAAFLVMAVPPSHFTLLPGLATFPMFQPVLAAMLGVALGALGYVAMRLPGRRVSAYRAPVDAVEDEPEGALAAAEVSLRLRRADRHPDAPAREPIFASRDLGSPFMEVAPFAPAEDAAPIPEGDYAEVAAATPDRGIATPDVEHPEPAPDPIVPEEASHWFIDDAVAAPAPRPLPRPEIAEPVVAAPAPDPVAIPEPVAAFVPEVHPVPAPARAAQRTSIAEMMDRLSAGLEQRAGGRAPVADAAAPRARDRRPALREALDELNRLAARRG